MLVKNKPPRQPWSGKGKPSLEEICIGKSRFVKVGLWDALGNRIFGISIKDPIKQAGPPYTPNLANYGDFPSIPIKNLITQKMGSKRMVRSGYSSQYLKHLSCLSSKAILQQPRICWSDR